MILIIAGATGTIGKALYEYFKKRNHTVFILTRCRGSAEGGIFERSSIIEWNPNEPGDWAVHIPDRRIDCIINLAGASLAGRRWTKSYKQQILESRVAADVW